MPSKTATFSQSLADTLSRLPFAGLLAGNGAPQDEATRAMRGMKREEFDARVAEAFRCQGYAVKRFEEDDRERGDMLLAKGGRNFLVLCREWRNPRIGIKTLEAFHNAMAARLAAGGFIVTCGKFADDVENIPRMLHIEVVNGSRLASMLR